jgi:Alginate lyase
MPSPPTPNALAWYISGDRGYAEKAISITDAWSGVIQSHTNSNAPLQTGWAGSTWPRAAEIIRHTNAGWAPASVERFETMLRTVYLPVVMRGSSSNGNWELSMLEAAVGISVFLDGRASYNKSVDRFKARVPAFLYLESDGPQPVSPPTGRMTPGALSQFWHAPSTFVDGLAQETCRDLTHTGYGIAAIAHTAETTRLQGNDLLVQFKDRLGKALEFHADLELGGSESSWCAAAG